MAEELKISSSTSRAEKYQELLPQVKSLTEGESSLIANLANTVAALRQTFGFFWVGFYLVEKNELVLGPFQGEIACTRIACGKGVCGAAWKESKATIVPNVDDFPGHIACNSASRSEIVVPILVSGKVVAVLDVDSDQLDDFTATDQLWLEAIAAHLSQFFK